MGDWPVIADSKWNESSWRWQDAASKIEALRFWSKILIDFKISTDAKNTSKRVILVRDMIYVCDSFLKKTKISFQ